MPGVIFITFDLIGFIINRFYIREQAASKKLMLLRKIRSLN